MNLTEKLQQLKKEKKAILAANFYNFETLSGILTAAQKTSLPVILQLSESSIRYMGIGIASVMAKKALTEYNVEGWLHLDHGSSLEMVKICLDHGFDSVMIDASEKPFEENMAISSKAIAMAKAYHANVEAELGFVAKLGQDQLKGGFTQPEEAMQFAAATGIHALAVSIGSAHGFYKQAPNLDITLLSRISKAVSVPLVLHGSSGIPDAMLQEAIRNGICKVNLATETKNAFMLALKDTLNGNDEIDLRVVFPKATQAVIELISNKLDIIYKA